MASFVETSPRAGAVVLVADASAETRARIDALLGRAGFRVETVADAAAAVERCGGERPDVVVVSAAIDAAAGIVGLRSLQAAHAQASVPVLVLSPTTEPDDVSRALADGVHDFVRVPFDPGELLARVTSAWRTKTLHEELLRQCRTDSLTDLPNRRATTEAIAGLLSGGASVAAALVDVDHFKKVNDTYGHAIGDGVLTAVAGRMARRVPAGWLLGRWGGEEFVVAGVSDDAAGAAVAADRIRGAVERDPVAVGAVSLATTVSVGLAVGVADDVDELLRVADIALYRAKAAGRNRVEVAPWHGGAGRLAG